ncbi:MAG: hypothetical protein WAK17_24085 [Candidatus Nitrosopolaris sp.]|jgi:hypothetical protein
MMKYYCSRNFGRDGNRRQTAEIVFSFIKRILGEDLFSKFATQKAEAGLNVL